jgi:predicted transcriptional regulator
MSLKDLFKQDVARPIETVIKADDQENVLQEVEEYVVTDEIAKKIRDFFASYNDYAGANGVWISGFFGSGKSHLLKILSYILENKEYDGKQLGELFASKIEDDEMLRADVLRATKTPSESILFNIDQQAQITTKGEEDAILNVFYKVLNDHQGYFGAQRHVAEFERWLDNEGKYADFVEGFEKEAGEHWTVGRRKYFAPKTKDAIAQSLAKINGDAADKYKDIIDTLRKDNRISVEDFCDKVNEYITQKGAGFRLNFFVDEVGQFISDNTKLMLNLQTVAETLASRCKGRAWLLVTSQEDLESVVGDDSKLQSDDFSKIQGRFKIRVPLTSANVDEVIEKRLLTKTEDATKELTAYFKKEQANLETILSFSEAGVQFRKFKDEKDFVGKYPFVPYQFDLFQQCIKELSKHNAFQGKHASVGERSMLGVFQEVLKDMATSDGRVMVSFDLMFEGIRSTIRGEIQNAITLAEKNITNKFAIKVLKTLFLVKYYTNFKTTARNVSVLMLETPDVDLKEHDKKVQEALNLLENQTYIQRNGEFYEFLTDDEKDIEEEIKSTDIDNQNVTQLLNEIIFDSIIGEGKIKYLENKQEYEFTKRIDGVILGKERELAIEVITPNSDNFGNTDFYKAQTMGYQTLMLMALPADERVVKDARLYLKTEKYIRQNNSTSNKDSIKRILYDKGQQNAERKRNLNQLLKGLLGESRVYMNGAEHNVGSTSDGKTKVINVFQDLIKLAYPNLRMLGSTQYSEETIKSIIRSKQDDLFGTDDQTMGEAELEIYNLIVRRKKQSDRTTLNDLKELFSKKSYGWYQNAIFTVVAKLYKRGKVEAKQDSNMLSDEDFLANMLNNRTFSNTLLEPQVDFDQRLVKKLKDVYQELFDEACALNDARDIANSFKEKCKKEARELNQLIGNKANYPFLGSLESLTELLEKISEMDYNVVITNVGDFENELLDQKEGILDPIRKFWNGDQKKIFDAINTYLNGDQSNFEYVDDAELSLLREVHKNAKPFAGNTMKDAKEAMEKLQQKLLAKIEEERTETLTVVKFNIATIEEREDFKKLDDAKKRDVLNTLNDMISKTYGQRYVAQLRQYRVEANNHFTTALNRIQDLLAPKDAVANEPKVQYIKQSNVKVSFSKTELKTAEDVEAYVEALKEELLRQIKENRRITL